MTRRRRCALALLAAASLVGAACGSGDDDAPTTASTEASDRDDDGPDFTPNDGSTTPGSGTPAGTEPGTTGTLDASDRSGPDEQLPVSITAIDFEAGTITITNHGTESVDLGDIWICEFPDYLTLDPMVVAGGESVTVPFPNPSKSDGGEMALYRSDDFADPDAILSYVEWGSPGHERASVAIAAEIWGDDAVDAGLVLSTGGAFARDASGWSVLTTLGGDVISPPATTARPRDPPGSTTPGATTQPAGVGTTTPPPDDYDPDDPPPPPPPSAPATPPPPPPDDY